jgi:acetyltransferase-like isoleucine patch superfamily enzyme
MFLAYIKRFAKSFLFRKRWRSINIHNETVPVNYFDSHKVKAGKRTYGSLYVLDESPEKAKLIIGSYCSIAPGVRFLLGGEHNTNSISTYPFKVKSFGYKKEAGSKGDIVVGDDVWIGMGAIICSGVKIGQGAIIAAGSVVTRSVEPYAIVGGNPARPIRFRFGKELCENLLKMDICELFESFEEDDIDLIYAPLSEEIMSTLLKKQSENRAP